MYGAGVRPSIELSLPLALFVAGLMSDLRPECVPKRTFVDDLGSCLSRGCSVSVFVFTPVNSIPQIEFPVCRCKPPSFRRCSKFSEVLKRPAEPLPRQTAVTALIYQALSIACLRPPHWPASCDAEREA